MLEPLAVLDSLKPTHNERFDVVIIGAGPAGMSAAVCCARADLKTLIIERALPGGGVSSAFKVHNVLGFPGGIVGQELGKRMESHILDYNLAYTNASVDAIENKHGLEKKVVTELGECYYTRYIIIATGLEPKLLNTDFESQFTGRGISYFADCDGSSYTGKTIGVVGGGNCACYAADYLSQFAEKIYMIHRSDSLKSVSYLKKRILNNPKIQIMWQTHVTEAFGIDKLEKIKVENLHNHQTTWLDLKGLFIYVGRIPSEETCRFGVALDEEGFILTDDYMRTDIPGIYAAGDIRSKQIRQIQPAIADGMIAAVNIGKIIAC
jgi:thioredoxin reductase (NADPH)